MNESWEERQATGHGELRQVAGGETPDEVTERADVMILGLRLMRGVDIEGFTVRFRISPDAAFGPAIAKHEALGLRRAEGRLRLTERGLLLSNEVFVDLLPDSDE